MKLTFRFVKRIIVAVVGFTILLIGIALLVLPGPAFIVIPVGLAVLASEFVWAKKLLEKVTPKFLSKSKTNKESDNAN